MSGMSIGRGHFWYGDYPFVDPDFDDEWSDCEFLAHEIEMTGAAELHPDGFCHDLDVVPLVSRQYTEGIVAELKKREWAQHLKDRKAWQEQHEHERELRSRALDMRNLEVTQAQLDEALSELPAGERPPSILAEMKPHDPLAPGQGRVVGDYVMIREQDRAVWAGDPGRARLPLVWQGRGLLIFRLRS
jgi:hypothetical protein